MKVLFCAYDRPGHLATGPNAWLQRLLPDLSNEYKIEVSLIVFTNGSAETCPTVKYFREKNIDTITFNLKELHFIQDQVKVILKTFRKTKSQIFVPNLVISGYYACKYLQKSNIPCIGVIHSNDLFYHSVIQNFINGRAENAIDNFVCVSDYLAQKAISVNKHQSKITAIPCGTPTSNKKSSFQGNLIKVMYAGRIEVEQKQIIKLTTAFIKASQQNKNVAFDIYGTGTEADKLAQILQENKSHSVSFNGGVAPTEIQDIMLKHHVFTLMSDYEGMPVALMEAMACGLVPVCLAEESGINEIIEDGENGFIVNDKGAEYQQKINYLQENPEEWLRMSNNAIATIQDRYSTEVTHGKWVKLFEELKLDNIKRIHIPTTIKIRAKRLYYGDKRKPPFKARMNSQFASIWLRTRLFLRPRDRMKNILGIKS